MPRYLMDFCFKYQEGECRVDEINNARRAKEIGQDGKFPLFPSGKAQEKLDQICEKCSDRMFEISKLVCLVCSGDVGPAHFITEWQAGSRRIYQYRCVRCDSLLYSSKKMV